MKLRMKMMLVAMMVVVLLSGCGAGSIAGEYVGQEAGGILTISADKTWSYQQEDYWGSGETDLSGTYSKGTDGSYVLECEDIILYAEKVSDDVLEVTSNLSSWSAEDFRRME